MGAKKWPCGMDWVKNQLLETFFRGCYDGYIAYSFCCLSQQLDLPLVYMS